MIIYPHWILEPWMILSKGSPPPSNILMSYVWIVFPPLAASIPTQYLWQSCVHRWHSERQRKSDRQFVVSDTAVFVAASCQWNGKKSVKVFCVCYPPHTQYTHTHTLKEKQAAGSCGKCKLYMVTLCLVPAVVTEGFLRIVSSAIFLSLHLWAASCYRKQMSTVSGFLVCPGNCLLTGKGAVLLAISGCCVSVQLICICWFLQKLSRANFLTGNPGNTAACFF